MVRSKRLNDKVFLKRGLDFHPLSIYPFFA